MQDRGDLTDRIFLEVKKIDHIPVFGTQRADCRKDSPCVIVRDAAVRRRKMIFRQSGERETALMPRGFEIIEAAVDG